jgi:hypothetical protein
MDKFLPLPCPYAQLTGETELTREAVDSALLNMSGYRVVFVSVFVPSVAVAPYLSHGVRKVCPAGSRLGECSVVCNGSEVVSPVPSGYKGPWQGRHVS